MPYVITGEPSANKDFSNLQGSYDYDYPEGLDLRPGGELHKSVINKVLSMSRSGHETVSKRFASWNEMDQILTVFTRLSDEELRSLNKDEKKPVSIVFPYSYAILEALLSYMVAAYFQDPIFQYQGHSGEDVIGSILLTKAIQLHCNRSKVPLALHTMFRDAFTYGLGIAVPNWKVQRGTIYKSSPRGFISKLTSQFKQTGVERIAEEGVLWEGNELINIDPYKVLLDPNTPVHKLQDSDFFGWIENTNLNNLLGEERDDDEMFNVKYARHSKTLRSAVVNHDPSDRDVRVGGFERVENYDHANPADRIHMYANIVPKNWKLGDSEYPEKWYFQIVGDSLLVKAQPLGLGHGLYPAAICAPDYDGYSSSPISRLEMLGGLQGTLDWLFNTHIKNVRKAINDMFVYDPYLINSKDLENPKEGWLIRSRRPAWGKGVKDAIQQLNVNDVTRQNVADSAYLVQWMEKVGATDGPMMGALRQGGPERLTGKEFEGTRQGAFSRLERVAKIIGWQAMQDIGMFFAMHTQQLMTEEAYINILGDWETVLLKEYGGQAKKGRLKIKPTDLLVGFDVLVRDGSIPGGNYSSVWERMFEVIAKTPQLAEQFDLGRIFKHIARNNGAQNVDEFVKVQVAPDEQVLQQAQQGNIQPFGRETA